jgi:hypothetical protein
MPDFTPELLRYFEVRERQRMDAIGRTLATLRPYERRLVREAAVMGYVRGAMAGRSRATLGEPRDGDIPPDASILADVIGACIAMDYPYLAAASEGRRRRITKTRLWPGERYSDSPPDGG